MKRRLFYIAAIAMLGSFMQLNSKVLVELTMKDGRMARGVTNSLFIYGSHHQLKVTDEESGVSIKLESAELQRVRICDSDAREWATYIPVKAQRGAPTIWRKNPRVYSDPVFLLPTYEGECVSAYKHFIPTETDLNPDQIYGTNCLYYFKLSTEDTARTYWVSTVSTGVKATLRKAFKDIPEMSQLIDSIDEDKFLADPSSIIRQLDEVLQHNK